MDTIIVVSSIVSLFMWSCVFIGIVIKYFDKEKANG